MDHSVICEYSTFPDVTLCIAEGFDNLWNLGELRMMFKRKCRDVQEIKITGRKNPEIY